MGGGVRISKDTAIRRTRLFITQKLHSNLRKIHSDDRALILHLLVTRFGFTPSELTNAFPWSRSTIYEGIKNGAWMESNLKSRLIKPRIDSFLSYLLYNDRYIN